MKLSIVLSTQAARFNAVAFQGDFAAHVAKIAAWGYDGVELAIRDPRLVDGSALLETVTRYGLSVPAIGTGQAWGEEGLSFTDPDPAVRQAAIQRTIAHVPLAAQANALIIVGLLRGIVRPGVSPQQAMTWLVDALRRACAAARAQDVRICLEPINRYETTLINNVREGLDLIERVGADNLGLLLDTFHMNIEEPVIEEGIRAAADRLYHVHVADSNRWHPGAGHVDFASVIRTLREIGYDGWLSAEIMPAPDPDTAARRTIEYLRRMYELTNDE